MRTRLPHLLPLTPLLLAGLAHAGDPTTPYNRRAVAVAKTANGDGTTSLHALVQAQVPIEPAAPLDLSMFVELRINGVPLGTTSYLALPAMKGHSCAVADYAACVETALGAAGCAQLEPDGIVGACTIGAVATVQVPSSTILPGDVLTAHVVPAPGAMPELDLGDDATAPKDGVVDGDDFLTWRGGWGGTATPSAKGPGLVDLHFELETGTGGTSPVDLSTSVDVQVNGVITFTDLVVPSYQTGGTSHCEIPDVPAKLGDEIVILLRPAPGALPDLPGFEPPPLVIAAPTLVGDVDVLPVSAGGTQSLTVQAGAAHAGEIYWILGSLSGTAPGTPAGSFVLPLNPDPYFTYTLNHPNSGLLVDTFGHLDAVGEASAAFVLPFASPPALAGQTVHHAAVLLDAMSLSVTGVTNPVKLELL